MSKLSATVTRTVYHVVETSPDTDYQLPQYEVANVKSRAPLQGAHDLERTVIAALGKRGMADWVGQATIEVAVFRKGQRANARLGDQRGIIRTTGPKVKEAMDARIAVEHVQALSEPVNVIEREDMSRQPYGDEFAQAVRGFTELALAARRRYLAVGLEAQISRF